MDKIMPNGTEVLIFYDFKGQSRGANEREFVKGVVVNSRESNDLSYHGSAWYEQIVIFILADHDSNCHCASKA